MTAPARIESAAQYLASANANLENGKLFDALGELNAALVSMPNSPQVHWNRGQVLLALGCYEEGFKEYEWRLQLFANRFKAIKAPCWSGENLAGKTLLLVHEHGYGDTIMMLRYVSVLQKMGATVVLALPPPLMPLAKRLFVDVYPNVPEQGFDYYCPMFGVMAALGHGVKDIPHAPYLHAFNFRKRNGVGIAWSGNPEHANDARRSIPIRQFVADLGLNIYYSVQNTAHEEAAKLGVVTSNFENFAETADLMGRLDHIVTVDTAAAHLAGAIGHESVHLLLPAACDWRWHYTYAWYPGVNVYKQADPGDWSGPLSAVRKRISR